MMITILSKRNGARIVFYLMALAVLLAVYLQVQPKASLSAGVPPTSTSAVTTLQAAAVPDVAHLTKPKRARFHKKRADPGSGGGSDDGEDDFNEYVCKGEILVQYMSMTEQEVTADLIRRGKLPAGGSSQSQYTQLANLQTNGWRRNPGNPNINAEELNFEGYLSLAAVLGSLGLSTSVAPSGDNELVSWEHAADAVINGKQYWATQADYTNVYNPRQGAIIANFNYGPLIQIQRNGLAEEHPDITAPPLKQWSDVVFLEYQSECQAQGQPIDRLQYFFRYQTQDPRTEYVVDACLDPAQDRPDEYDEAPAFGSRRVYTMDTEEGKALLASPNGSGVAWFLIQHRQQLGHKRVRSVSVFREDVREGVPYAGPTLLFEIEDVS
ncbi:hypothetical protein LTR85_003978 [Meristemomyces frigidus]|nr:hypothetical protein LTR85_003978 [Meristemomyces frigidus]